MVYEVPLKYGFKRSIPGLNAQEVGEYFESFGEKVTPKQIVDASRKEGTLLHNQFEWRDGIAAEKYRESQAAGIIRNLIVVVDREEEKEPTTVRAYVPTPEKEESGIYQPISVVVKDTNSREVLLKRALDELLAFKRKYQDLLEFTKFFDEIDKLKEALA